MQKSGMFDSPNDLHIPWEDSVEKLNKIPYCLEKNIMSALRKI